MARKKTTTEEVKKTGEEIVSDKLNEHLKKESKVVLLDNFEGVGFEQEVYFLPLVEHGNGKRSGIITTVKSSNGTLMGIDTFYVNSIKG